MTGLKGAARNPTALTALRPAGSCNSAVSIYPVSRSLHRAKADGVLFLIFQCAFSRGSAHLFRQGASQAHDAPVYARFNGKVREGRITVWNTRIAAHRTTAHFFRYPHPPRAGAVLVLIQYHATRPGGIAAPPSPAPRVRYAPGLHRICARAARAVLLRIAPRLYAVYASRNLRTQQNIIFAAFKRLFARHVFALSALFCIFNVLSVYQSKASVISPNPPRIRSCTSPDALTSFLSTSAAPSKSCR